MSLFLSALADPQVKAVMNEFFELDASGEARVTTAEGQEGIRAVIVQLFTTIGDLLTEHTLVTDALDFETNAEAPRDYVALCQQAMEFSTGAAFPQSVVALYLLRSKLRSLGEKAKDEREVITIVDGTVGLLAPGVSVLAAWESNREQCARLWACLNDILRVMDQHCPDASSSRSAAPPPPPAEATTPAPCTPTAASPARG